MPTDQEAISSFVSCTAPILNIRAGNELMG